MSNVPPPPGVPGQPQLDVGEAVGYGWKKFQQYAGPLILIVLIIVRRQPDRRSVLRFTIDSLFLGALLAVLFCIIGQILTIGIINASLMVTRGETPEVGKAFSTEHLGQFIVGSILYGLIVADRPDPLHHPRHHRGVPAVVLRLLHPRPRHAAPKR